MKNKYLALDNEQKYRINTLLYTGYVIVFAFVFGFTFDGIFSRILNFIRNKNK